MKQAENTDIRKEKMFLTRNRLADRWILLTTRRPSATTDGMVEKSDSSKTNWETCAAASQPDAMATEQSASFRASTSLTPSPVMPTVCPALRNARTSSRFCSGVTRPNTVYCSAADRRASSVSNVEAST